MTDISNHCCPRRKGGTRRRSVVGTCAVSLLAWACALPAHGQMSSTTPAPGLHAYARARGMSPNPPGRLGGSLTVKVSQKNGKARFILPGTRGLDPSIFGTPGHPAGFEPAPFPMSGIPLDLRRKTGDAYTIIDHACPFSDWSEKASGSVRMKLVDATAIDGATTKDKIDFEANFELPDGAKYRVVCTKPLAHGMAFPFFGGVVTNHLIHGGAGIAPRALPTAFAYAAFWGKGDVYKDGSLINGDQLVHVWVSEDIRGKGGRTRFDSEAGNRSKGLTLHMVVPPYRVTAQGMKKTPLKTMFMPFPYIKPNIMKEMKSAKKSGDPARIARAKHIKEVMAHTKEHVVQATAAGKMFGMPFIHMKFDDVKMKAGH
ncbi:MAG: hypothetical protein ACE5EX_07180 [Phycisphaerae bacterium]